MSFLVLILLSTSLLNGILGAPASTYDQQQSGDLNVRVDLKDIEIVALLNSDLLGDYGDYDYAYDYSDFTLKPITPDPTSPATSISSTASTTATPTTTTPTTTTITEKPWHTWPTIATPIQEPVKNESLTERLITDPPVSQFTEEKKEVKSEATVPQAISESVVNIVPEKSNEDSIASSTIAETPVTESQTRVLRRCNPGLARDQRGRCRLHIRRRIAAASSLLPYGIKLNPQTHRVRGEDHLKERNEN